MISMIKINIPFENVIGIIGVENVEHSSYYVVVYH